MNFETAEDVEHIRQAVRSMCERFPDEYWSEKEANHEFAWDFLETFADAGYLGICIPEEFGGSGAGVTEAAALMYEIAASGGALSACSTIHMPLFGLMPIIKHGSDALKQEYLPRAAEGKLTVSFGVTEPNSGTDTSRIKTTAKKVDGGYIVNGHKTWISLAQEAERVLLITRTTPREECKKPTEGMTLLFAELDRDKIEVRRIPKLGRNAVDSNELFIENLFVPDSDRIGEEGRGFRYLLDGLNPERVLVAAECLGMGRVALSRAVEYVKQRIVFDRPIGKNQGVQFPLAESFAKLDAAELIMEKAAWLYDNGLPAGKEANEAKLLCSTYAFEAADRALQFHGGYGYAKEYHVERYWREVRLLRITPIANEFVLAYLAEHEMGLPRSY